MAVCFYMAQNDICSQDMVMWGSFLSLSWGPYMIVRSYINTINNHLHHMYHVPSPKKNIIIIYKHNLHELNTPGCGSGL